MRISRRGEGGEGKGGRCTEKLGFQKSPPPKSGCIEFLRVSAPVAVGVELRVKESREL